MAWAIFSMLFLAIGGVVYGAAALIWFALTILANWLMFMKAGEAGWKSIIPVYNTYTAYKIAWTPNMFWIYFIFTVLESIFSSISFGAFFSFSFKSSLAERTRRLFAWSASITCTSISFRR